ncbi:MAG: alpha/beta fold hydrolase [Rhizobiaceae bacterium]
MKFLKWAVVALAVLAAAFWVSSWFTFSDSGPHAYAPVTEEEKAEAEAYIAAGLKPLPSGWQWGIFSPEAGIELRTGRVKTPASPGKGTILLIPGYTSMLELYSETIQNFVDDGYDVAGIEYRGQGLSTRELDNPEKGFVDSYDKMTNDIANYIEKLKADGAGDINVYASSMGAHLALRMAGNDQPPVEAYFLLTPMVKIETGAFPYNVARAIATFYSLSGLGEAFAPGQTPFVPGKEKLGTASPCMDNAKTAQIRDALYIRNEKYRVSGTTNQWVRRTMNSTDEISSPGFLERIDKPFFVVTAGDDKWVSTPAATQMCEALGSCEAAHYPESRHCIDREKPETTRDILDKAKAFFAAN